MSVSILTYREAEIDPDLIRKVGQLSNEIGNTPLYEVRNLLKNPKVRVLAKMEWRQLSGSVKARAAFSIIRSAINSGQLTKANVLLDATSGNTGIAYAAIAKRLGLSVELCLPENASEVRKEILLSSGAKLTLTSRFEGTDGAQEKALQLKTVSPEKYFYADQYSNKANWEAHYFGTAREIIKEVPEITHFVAGLGTTGTFTGTSRRIREFNPNVERIALQPNSPMHGLEGWKHLETAKVPAFYDTSLATSFIEVDTAEVYDFILKAYKYEGLWLSPSSAANLLISIKISETLDSGTIVTVLPDNADKYQEIINHLIHKRK